jgi:NADH:ubiquinone oxidoreductase subunit F (NADH-binding)
MDILTKIKEAGLVGRGGASFPTWRKWAMVKDALGEKKYVVCNASEGEPGVKKDKYILENYPEQVIDGIQRAMEFLLAERAFIYLNPDYFKELKPKLEKFIGNAKYIELFKKPHGSGYIGGEETGCINTIEGERTEPRLRPPFPTTNGLWGYPTLINNVETFYNVSIVVAGKYKKNRFYTIDGDCLWEGVYELPENYTIERILKETRNYPDFSFFVQAGGAASGEILNSDGLKKPASGVGSIRIYSLEKHNPKDLILNWLNFFQRQSCGQCTTCREGTYRLVEEIKKNKLDWELINDLLANLEDSSFCALGYSAPIAVSSFLKNALPLISKNRIV